MFQRSHPLGARVCVYATLGDELLMYIVYLTANATSRLCVSDSSLSWACIGGKATESTLMEEAPIIYVGHLKESVEHIRRVLQHRCDANSVLSVSLPPANNSTMVLIGR